MSSRTGAGLNFRKGAGMSERREKLLAILREPRGDEEAAHSRAESALLEWLEEFDPEVSQAWATAQKSQNWWYA